MFLVIQIQLQLKCTYTGVLIQLSAVCDLILCNSATSVDSEL